MPDLKDGESAEVQGSARAPVHPEERGRRLFLHLPGLAQSVRGHRTPDLQAPRGYRGEQAEQERLGSLAAGGADGRRKRGADTAPKLLLAHPWENDTDLTGWWMSEKLDGVRAWWDGQQFLSRLGNVYHAPDWFVAGLPACRWTANCGSTARRSSGR